MARYANTRIDQLPAGQQRYLNIGLAAMAGPDILLLDDPTSALDPHLKREMFQQLRRLADRDAKDGQSVILATHDVESRLLDHCDRLMVLQPGGRMAFFGLPGRRTALLRPGGLGRRLPGVRRGTRARLFRRVPRLAPFREIRGHPNGRPPATARRGAPKGNTVGTTWHPCIRGWRRHRGASRLRCLRSRAAGRCPSSARL